MRLVNKILLFCCVASLIIFAPKQKSAYANIEVTKQLIESATDFSAGKFGLTSLTQGTGVQLISIGTLGRWTRLANTPLCEQLSDMGTAVYKNNIYTVGGLTRVSSVTSAVSRVCRSKVIATTGELAPFVFDKSLPQDISLLRAVAVDNPSNPNQGILYAFGGKQNVLGSGGQLNTVYSAIINADGTLQAWQEQANLLPEEVDSHAIAYYTNDNHQTFIYIIGGQRQFQVIKEAFSKIWRTEVGANGVLSPWQELTTPVPIPVNALGGSMDPACLPYVGIYDHEAFSFDGVIPEGEKRLLAVMGGNFYMNGGAPVGCVASTTTVASSKTFLAEIQQNGDLVWQTNDYNLPNQMTKLRAVGISNKIYAAAGFNAATNAVSNIVYSSYITDSFQLATFGTSGGVAANFIVNSNSLTANEARSAHGLVQVNYNNRSMVYLFGGTSTTTDFRRDVMLAFVGNDEEIGTANQSYPTTGLYVSPPYQLRAIAAITKVQWTATVTSAGNIQTDILMQYRIGTNTSSLASAPWINLDGDPGPKTSQNGLNTALVSNPTLGRYFQFRAQLSTNTPTDKSATPVLKAPISVTYSIDGYPNLYVESATASTVELNSFTFNTVVKNDRNGGTTGNIIDADIEAEGILYVDMYVFPPGATVVPPTRDANGAYPPNSSAYMELNRNTFPAFASVTLPETAWRQNCSVTPCPPVNWQLMFNKRGTWTVFITIDSSNNVKEADTIAGPWESDNIYRFDVISNIEYQRFYLPIILKGSMP